MTRFVYSVSYLLAASQVLLSAGEPIPQLKGGLRIDAVQAFETDRSVVLVLGLKHYRVGSFFRGSGGPARDAGLVLLTVADGAVTYQKLAANHSISVSPHNTAVFGGDGEIVFARTGGDVAHEDFFGWADDRVTRLSPEQADGWLAALELRPGDRWDDDAVASYRERRGWKTLLLKRRLMPAPNDHDMLRPARCPTVIELDYDADVVRVTFRDADGSTGEEVTVRLSPGEQDVREPVEAPR